MQQSRIFSKVNTDYEQILAASDEVSLQLASKLAEKFKSVALSHQTVAQWIDAMSEYISKKICASVVEYE